jgi:hypothetical protein
MITTDSPLISTSSAEVQRALVNVGSTILPTLFKDALKASAILGLKMESRSSEEAMHSLPGLQLANVSSSGFVYHERTQFIRRNEFHRICGKSGSDGQEKSEEERDFHWMQGLNALDQEKSAMAR